MCCCTTLWNLEQLLTYSGATPIRRSINNSRVTFIIIIVIVIVIVIVIIIM